MVIKNYTKRLSSKRIHKLTGKDIICISSMPYSGMWTRKQRLMTLLAEMGNRVLYVEPSNPLFTSVGDKGEYNLDFREAKDNLFILRPRGRLPLARYGLIQNINLRRFARDVKITLSKLNFNNPIIFTYLPVINAHTPFNDLLDYFDYSLLVYDCVDEHSETIGYSPQASEMVHNWDLELTARADIVFVTAKSLYDDRKHLNRHLYYSPNGVNVNHFSKATQKAIEIPSDLAVIPEPRIGFVGSLSDWIDYRLIAKIAKRHPYYNIVLIGPLKRGLKPTELEGLENVHLLGKKDLKDLPDYLRGVDCGINPFKKVKLAEKVNPLKVYEYLAAGLTVVSVDMPEVVPLEGVIYIGRSDEEFIEGVEKVINGEFLPDKRKLEEVLAKHNWDKIFGDLIEIVAKRIYV